MASVHQQPGRPFWYCAYTDHEGKRRFVSTKTSDRKEAEKISIGIQATVEKARTNRITPDNARAVIESVVEDLLASVGATLEKRTTRQFLCDVWLKGKTGSTADRYAGMVQTLLDFLGPKADRPLNSIGSADMESFKNREALRVSPSTVRLTIKVLRGAFKRAIQLQLVDKNPFSFVEVADDGERVQKSDFTTQQIDGLIQVADEDWRTMIYLGMFTGQRLQDLANLQTSNVDLVENLIRLRTCKTGRIVEIPMAPQLKERLSAGPISLEPEAYLLPNLAGKRSGWLSNQFGAILAKAGLAAEGRLSHRKQGNGRASRRMVNKYGFHSFRHTATSFLKNAGVPEAVARDIIGHDSQAVSRQYTHIDLATKRQAVKKMARHIEKSSSQNRK